MLQFMRQAMKALDNGMISYYTIASTISYLYFQLLTEEFCMSVQSSASLKRLNHLQCEMSVVYHEMSHLCGLSDSTMQILYTICNFGEESCLLRDICHLTGLPKQTINSALRKLEDEILCF